MRVNQEHECDKLILYCWAHLIEYIIVLPGIEILCPGLQNVWKTDGEVSQGYYGICSDHRKSRALQHRKHETDVFLTHRWAYMREKEITETLSKKKKKYQVSLLNTSNLWRATTKEYAG